MLAAGPTAGPDGQRVGLANAFALGAIDAAEMRRRLARAGVFVSLAAYEPFGLAVLEAALSGCALVLSDIPTFRELWGEVALFVASDDPGRRARRSTGSSPTVACGRRSPSGRAAGR